MKTRFFAIQTIQFSHMKSQYFHDKTTKSSLENFDILIKMISTKVDHKLFSNFILQLPANV
jgi:hypothetical protein